MRQRVVVLMSGGVDSSIAAALLQRQGYDCIGVHILGWTGTPAFPCPWQREERDARAVAAKLGIPFYTINLTQDYEQAVIRRFLDNYRRGFTPNPDVLCNKEIKFKALWQAVRQFEPDYLATGHYARIDQRPIRQLADKDQKFEIYNSQFVLPSHTISKARDRDKDQTYFLWVLEREMLPKILFPLGNFLKSEVRQLARKFKLPTADKKDSQGICFIGPLKVRQFLKNQFSPRSGPAVLADGRVVATHEGAAFYTIGQRLAAGSVSWTGDIPPLFVIAKDMRRNLLVVGSDQETFTDEAAFDAANWFVGVKDRFATKAKIRYRQEDVDCLVQKQKNGYLVKLSRPVRAIAPGQSIVFYNASGTLIGGGKITSVPQQEKILHQIYGATTEVAK